MNLIVPGAERTFGTWSVYGDPEQTREALELGQAVSTKENGGHPYVMLAKGTPFVLQIVSGYRRH